MHTTEQREQMVEFQIARRGLRDPHLLNAMRTVPRERFVSARVQEYAYEDSPLPIEADQTISQPYIVALMIDAAQLAAGERALEIGTGSGYAAAVMAMIADHVYTIERWPELSELALQRFRELAYTNIDVRTGDGTGGWPEQAPFDAILAAAGGPKVPEVLREQLAIGGRLVMPVGDRRGTQRLVKVTRCGPDRYEQVDLGGVMFVPLIGAHGWEDAASQRPPVPPPTQALTEDVTQRRAMDTSTLIRAAAEPLPSLDDPAFGRVFDRFGDARVVLLGEASHGTSEFYRARDVITRRLIEQHGFRIVAVEADWPDAAVVHRHVRGQPAQPHAAPAFQRFPTWMWRNQELATFVRWMRTHNQGRDEAEQAGFHGLDLYSMYGSIRAVIEYLDRVDPEAARLARKRYGCLTPWADEPAEYGHMALSSGHALCEKAVLEILADLLRRQLEDSQRDGDSLFDATQNARLVSNAEAYYRAMYYSAAESWNLRDRHMFDTLMQLLDNDEHAKAVVWAHNSHIGDARHTDMGRRRGELNLGQLCREEFGDRTALIGFGTHDGTVAAASDWGEPMQVMPVNPSLAGSYEREFHDAGEAACMVDLREGHGHSELRERLLEPSLERFIGVIYLPETERWSHYAQATLPRQFDAYVWFDRTSAVTPLGDDPGAGVPDTFPFGL